jgi:hypothetical protein
MRGPIDRVSHWGVVALAATLAGCAGDFGGTSTASITPVAETVTSQFVPGVPKGYQCPLVPNGFDPPGSIYRLDRDGTYFRVKDFTATPEIAALASYKREVKISNYQLADTQQANAGLSFDLLQKVLPGISASGSADYKKAMTVEITVEDMVGEVIDDAVADMIVELFEVSIKPKPGSKYFLVREAVKAGAVSYKLKQSDLARIGGKAEVEQLAKGAANVTVRDNDGVLELKQKFGPDRMSICIKSAEISIQPKRSGETFTNTALKTADDTAQPKIKRVGAH